MAEIAKISRATKRLRQRMISGLLFPSAVRRIAVRALNRMAEFGMPRAQRVA